MDSFSESLSVLAKLHREGKIVQAIDMQEGFDNIPSTLVRLFEGQNIGKQLLKLSDPAPSKANGVADFVLKLLGSYYTSKLLKNARKA